MLSGGISGADQLRRAARDLRRIHNRDIEREARGAVKGVVDEQLPGLIKASAAAHVPSGYAHELVPALRVKTTTTLAASRGVGVTVTIYASGQGEHRDVEALNRGILKHPVFGRTRLSRGELVASPWVTQRIPSGFADKTITAVRPKIVRGVDGALSRIADRFNSGG